jgi:hypothetical protein
MSALLWILYCPVFFSSASGAAPAYVSCDQDHTKQALRSKELQKIAEEDQADRKTLPLSPGVSARDRARRKRVGEIFGEGCLNTLPDYVASALVFQHGDRPDHFFQTFLWSKRAVELGDSSQKQMMGWGIDRYLVHTGHKQLFGSQVTKDESNPCWCMEPVEKSFPDSMRIAYQLHPLEEVFTGIDKMNAGAACPHGVQCKREVQDSPAGTVPGFW